MNKMYIWNSGKKSELLQFTINADGLIHSSYTAHDLQSLIN